MMHKNMNSTKELETTPSAESKNPDDTHPSETMDNNMTRVASVEAMENEPTGVTDYSKGVIEDYPE